MSWACRLASDTQEILLLSTRHLFLEGGGGRDWSLPGPLEPTGPRISLLRACLVEHPPALPHGSVRIQAGRDRLQPSSGKGRGVGGGHVTQLRGSADQPLQQKITNR